MGWGKFDERNWSFSSFGNSLLAFSSEYWMPLGPVVDEQASENAI